jgi:hypothetical protein
MPTPVPNIWQLQTKSDVDGLIEALRHPDATIRRGAAAALRALGAWQAFPALQAALAVERDWQVHAALTAALQYLDHDIHVEAMIKNRDVRGLTKMLNSGKADDVLTACRALADIGDRQAVEPLVMAFRNPLMPNTVKLAAAEALLKLESAPAVVTLLGALRRDNWQVRRNAAAVLGQLQAAWAVEPLLKALDDENQIVRRTAAAALLRIGTPEAVAAANAFEEQQRKLAPAGRDVRESQTMLQPPLAASISTTSTSTMPQVPQTPPPPSTLPQTRPNTRTNAARPDAQQIRKATGQLVAKLGGTDPTNPSVTPTATGEAPAATTKLKPPHAQPTATQSAPQVSPVEPMPTQATAQPVIAPQEPIITPPAEPVQTALLGSIPGTISVQAGDEATFTAPQEPIITPPPADSAPIADAIPKSPTNPTLLLSPDTVDSEPKPDTKPHTVSPDTNSADKPTEG